MENPFCGKVKAYGVDVMNRILKELRAIVDRQRNQWLPAVTDKELEKGGALFYMNGQNGTEFDWYVNDRLPSFMVFYNDKDNLGAVKLHLNRSGTADVFLYSEQGKQFLKQVTVPVEAAEQELMELAVLLRREADGKRLWDADIETMNTDVDVSSDAVAEFQSRQESYTAMRNRRMLLSQNACVSKKILEEGWKVGYMERNEPYNDQDSGWFFASGTEEEGYLDDYHNIQLLPVGLVWQRLDPDIFIYLDRPVGTRLIRVSSDQFEVDRLDREIYTVKR